MTFEKLNSLIEKHNIPKNVTLMSDSGWEIGATHMDGVYYNEKENTLVFTQGWDDYSKDRNKEETIRKIFDIQ